MREIKGCWPVRLQHKARDAFRFLKIKIWWKVDAWSCLKTKVKFRPLVATSNHRKLKTISFRADRYISG